MTTMPVCNTASQCGKSTPSPYSNWPSSLKIDISANRCRTRNPCPLKTMNIPGNALPAPICEQGREYQLQTDDDDLSDNNSNNGRC